MVGLSFVFMVELRRGSSLWDASDVWMMRISTCRATLLYFISAHLPRMSREEATITYPTFADDFPLIFSVGVLEHNTVWRGMIVGYTIFCAPCTFPIHQRRRVISALWMTKWKRPLFFSRAGVLKFVVCIFGRLIVDLFDHVSVFSVSRVAFLTASGR